MFVKDDQEELVEVQVKFDHPTTWQPESSLAIAHYIIACSQWEYVLELLYKDYCRNSQKSFFEMMIEADGVSKHNSKENTKLKAAMLADNDFCSQQIIKLVDQLEKLFSPNRHLLVHGFHHIYDHKEMMTKIHSRSQMISEPLDAKQYNQEALNINKLVNQINILRKIKFHNYTEDDCIDVYQHKNQDLTSSFSLVSSSTAMATSRLISYPSKKTE